MIFIIWLNKIIVSTRYILIIKVRIVENVDIEF